MRPLRAMDRQLACRPVSATRSSRPPSPRKSVPAKVAGKLANHDPIRQRQVGSARHNRITPKRHRGALCPVRDSWRIHQRQRNGRIDRQHQRHRRATSATAGVDHDKVGVRLVAALASRHYPAQSGRAAADEMVARLQLVKVHDIGHNILPQCLALGSGPPVFYRVLAGVQVLRRAMAIRIAAPGSRGVCSQGRGFVDCRVLR